MSSTVRALWQAVGQASKSLHLESFKRVTVRIDPFHSNATAVRDFLSHVSASRVRLTNPECALKTEVLCDRSEPTIDIVFLDGRRAVVQCGHLSCLEVLQTVGQLGTAGHHGQGSQ
ncbi:39S ribosomal protein L53, mitochondrial [Rhipicephalus sanguineus]|uniref:39S ribosomal protein L53, mitochondrial n=1 Tax=Rhipicephalus sanguineus TaxID=34632 RepID=UPI001893C5DA|nr:39S ribosomal protein L53, mitochondrial [Rhipicephalus sanguineus]